MDTSKPPQPPMSDQERATAIRRLLELRDLNGRTLAALGYAEKPKRYRHEKKPRGKRGPYKGFRIRAADDRFCRICLLKGHDLLSHRLQVVKMPFTCPELASLERANAAARKADAQAMKETYFQKRENDNWQRERDTQAMAASIQQKEK